MYLNSPNWLHLVHVGIKSPAAAGHGEEAYSNHPPSSPFCTVLMVRQPLADTPGHHLTLAVWVLVLPEVFAVTKRKKRINAANTTWLGLFSGGISPLIVLTWLIYFVLAYMEAFVSNEYNEERRSLGQQARGVAAWREQDKRQWFYKRILRFARNINILFLGLITLPSI